MTEFEYGRCNYCKFQDTNKKCVIGLVPVKGELCYEKDCFLVVK